MTEIISTATPLKKGNRGKSWTTEEDVQLCRSWIKITGISAWDRGTGTFWERIVKDFYSHYILAEGEVQRSLQSVSARWRYISKRVNVYCWLLEEERKKNLPEDESYVSHKRINTRYRFLTLFSLMLFVDILKR